MLKLRRGDLVAKKFYIKLIMNKIMETTVNYNFKAYLIGIKMNKSDSRGPKIPHLRQG